MKKNIKRIIIISLIILLIWINIYVYLNLNETKVELNNAREKLNLNTKKQKETEEKIDNEKWYELLDYGIIIDYPIFNKNTSNSKIEEISKYLNRIDESGPDGDGKSIDIENINWTDFYFINKLITSVDFTYIDYDFDKYNDEDNYIFEPLWNFQEIIDLRLTFMEGSLSWGSLIRTFEKFRELNEWNRWGYFWFHWEMPGTYLQDTYSITRQELKVLHDINVFWLYLDFWINYEKDWFDEIQKVVLSNNFWEYSLSWAFSKFTWNITRADEKWKEYNIWTYNVHLFD